MHETVLDDLNDAEREFETLFDELKANRTEVHEEAHSLFSLTKQFVRRSEELEVGVATRQGTRGSEEPWVKVMTNESTRIRSSR